MSGGSWKADVFDRLYADNPDPWGFESSPYERAKYADTLAQLDGRLFGAALELGCSIGVMSQALAAQCSRLLSLDLAEAALVRARKRCAGLDQVSFRRATLPQDWPDGRFDLVVVSEMLYFLAPPDIVQLAERCIEAAAPDCTILLVNWTGPTDTPTTGDEAAQLFCSCFPPTFTRDAALHRDRYRLDRLRRSECRS